MSLVMGLAVIVARGQKLLSPVQLSKLIIMLYLINMMIVHHMFMD
jgi:hypothetical protein